MRDGRSNDAIRAHLRGRDRGVTLRGRGGWSESDELRTACCSAGGDSSFPQEVSLTVYIRSTLIASIAVSDTYSRCYGIYIFCTHLQEARQKCQANSELSPLEVSAPVDAERFVFVGGASGWEGDWHPSPTKQFVFILRGEFEVSVSDGEVRSFGPGSVVLLEDTTGRGHFTRITSDDFGLCTMVHLE